jgi:HD-GYP domain-containing protein (c-di-GMP phosphodiesterase class II)
MLMQCREEHSVQMDRVAGPVGYSFIGQDSAFYPVGLCANHCEFLHQFAESLGNTVDARDTATYNHSREVAEVGYLLACAMKLQHAEAVAVHIAGHLHDIGKIGIPDSVLKKDGPLDLEDWHWIKKHPEIGARIVRPVEAFNGIGGIADMILSHHERYDGGGYPLGLTGEAIPVGARIIAVADTLSALLQDRPYRRGTSLEAAVGEIIRCSGTQFDPAVVTALRGILGPVGKFFLGRYFHRDSDAIKTRVHPGLSSNLTRF